MAPAGSAGSRMGLIVDPGQVLHVHVRVALGRGQGNMTEQLLDVWGHTYAILNPLNQLGMAHQPADYCAALESAVNDAVAAEWVEPDARFYGSICVPFEYPDLAVAEIERLAPNPRFVQVLFNVVTMAPVGNRRYWPIYEAATAHDLPVALHVAGGRFARLERAWRLVDGRASGERADARRRTAMLPSPMPLERRRP